ncbi:MAG: hypothetical protein ACREQM_13130 [Candidatus Dormibacteraceae bacterium]
MPRPAHEPLRCRRPLEDRDQVGRDRRIAIGGGPAGAILGQEVTMQEGRRSEMPALPRAGVLTIGEAPRHDDLVV